MRASGPARRRRRPTRDASASNGQNAAMRGDHHDRESALRPGAGRSKRRGSRPLAGSPGTRRGGGALRARWRPLRLLVARQARGRRPWRLSKPSRVVARCDVAYLRVTCSRYRRTSFRGAPALGIPEQRAQENARPPSMAGRRPCRQELEVLLRSTLDRPHPPPRRSGMPGAGARTSPSSHHRARGRSRRPTPTRWRAPRTRRHFGPR